MKMKLGKINLLILILLTITSCSRKNLVYFSDLPANSKYTSKVDNIPTAIYQPGDILDITVNSLSTESNALFNSNIVLRNPASATVSNGDVNSGVISTGGYLIDNAGFINFPVIGKIKVSGLTSEQTVDLLTKEVQKYVKSPIVNVRLINFKVTVIGEVAHPSSFTVPNEKINVLEALGMAGDMTVYGKRGNVLVIREKEGVRSLSRIDLNSKAVFTSPYFNLQQNDVVYVEPSKEKASSVNPNTKLIPILTAAISALAIIYSRYAFQ